MQRTMAHGDNSTTNQHAVSHLPLFYSINYTLLPLYFEKSVLFVGELVEKKDFSDFIVRNHVC
jgi:lipocalin